MGWEISLINILIVIGFYESSHAYLYYRSKEVRKEGRVRVRVLDINEENALTLNSLFFRNTVVFLSSKISEEILRHEEGHTRQFNYMYVYLVLIASLLPLGTFIVIPSVFIGKFILWGMERDADLYAFTNYNIMYMSDIKRPQSRVERLITWLLDSHPPDWVRGKREYYEKKYSLIKLLLKDLFS